MPWLALAEKPFLKPKSRAFLHPGHKPSIMVPSQQPQPVTPRPTQNGGCPNNSIALPATSGVVTMVYISSDTMWRGKLICTKTFFSPLELGHPSF
jgi:hypothetical protein